VGRSQIWRSEKPVQRKRKTQKMTQRCDFSNSSTNANFTIISSPSYFYSCVFCKMFITTQEDELFKHLHDCEYAKAFFTKKKGRIKKWVPHQIILRRELSLIVQLVACSMSKALSIPVYLQIWGGGLNDSCSWTYTTTP